MDDPDFLYEDLFEDLEDGKSVIKTSLHEMEDRMKILSNEAEELRLQVRNLQEQNEGLSKQNEVLIRNISCLFKTAQLEISRKDKQIRSLQEESRKMNAINNGSPASTASARAAVVGDKPYLTAVQAEGKTGEACTTSGGMGKRGLLGGKHGDYAAMEARRGNKDKMGEKPLPLGGIGKQGRNSKYAAMHTSEDCKCIMGETFLASNGAQCDRGALEFQTDCKDDMGRAPLASDGMRRRGHHRNGHQDDAAMIPEANLKGRIKETPGGTEKQNHYEDDHCDYAIKTSQADHNGISGELFLASDGIGKPQKSANLELQGDYKGRVKETTLESIGCEKPGHHDDIHVDCTAMASGADCKGSEKETFLTSSGMENGNHLRDDHRDYLEMRRSCSKSGESLDEMWKRRRREGEYVAAGNEYCRRRADERYPLDAKKGERATNAYRPLDAHKAPERREKGERATNAYRPLDARTAPERREKWNRL